ncbi:MAG: 2-oxoacid:ferredoxin oxidoreductase subunit beta, partial [Gemmatimonadetes bacterium]|nr:2-oxoacid:ferredoxin oxidoreductase subunit beta [Gemmatimonadota bacterium]NIT68778.1 2-oxoacid:ferredoxin oxidoreductase subunit beta [Gemmatimonadota bacterium]NIV25448.1 2-oxoacid:ferredoxin oxidoreductase subunit beta [Gemmatimonadota bacterium]NIW77501.1 2-oxoacid:ferredoxin oxidoreductase subunit beta [Gemmatimonadota bacterium]NIY37355.1 2-oxoacid:ferredoxin oxidoreductase subunit beta [Gemmatimonadota bacterium]
IVFNDDAFADFTDRKIADEMQVHVQHGSPLLFGKEMKKGLRVKPGTLRLEVVTVGEDGVSADDVLVHDETDR